VVPALTYTFTGLVNGDTSSVLSGGLTTSATASSDVGGYAIDQGTLSADGNYTISYAGGMLTVAPTALLITANDATKTYGAALPAFGATYGGLVNGDTSSVVSGLSFSTSATLGSNVGTYSIVPSGASASNYTISDTGGQLSIDPAPLALTVDNQSKTYGAALPALTYTATGLVNGDTSAVFSGGLDTLATTSSAVGTYAINEGTVSAGSNYAIGFTSSTLTVTPAALTVTALDASKVYGVPLPDFEATFGGLVNGDTPNSLGGTLGFSTSATASSPAGPYPVLPGGLTSANYSIRFVAGTLTVSPAQSTSSTPASPLASSPGGASSPVPHVNATPGPTPGANPSPNLSAGSDSHAAPSPLPGADAIVTAIAIQNTVASLPLIAPSLLTATLAPPSLGSSVASPPAVSGGGNLVTAVASATPSGGSTSFRGGPPAPAAPLVPSQAGPGGIDGLAQAAGGGQGAGAAVVGGDAAGGPQVVPQAATRPNGSVPMSSIATVGQGNPPAGRMQALRNGLLWSAMELFEENREPETLPEVVRAVVGAGVIASTGYVFLNSRLLYWLISALSSRPLWKRFDPLEVIFAWEEEEKERKKASRPHFWSRRKGRDDESLQSLVGGGPMDVRKIEEVAR
jgi:MBG domain (YGX type)